MEGNSAMSAQQATQEPTAYDKAAKAISEGRAHAHALWVLLGDERERDLYALKPEQWEGPGEYQRVRFDDGRDVFVYIPVAKPSFRTGEQQ
jgi:uncharacterized protein YpmB